MRKTILLALFSISAASCGEAANDLWGSIDESFALDFDKVEILKQELDMRIEYLKELPGGQEKICKLVIKTANLKITDNSDLKDDAFEKDIVTISRVAPTGGDFPNVQGGTVHFAKYSFVPEGRVDGDFTVLFENGRTLSGNFDSKVKEVSVE